MIGQGQEHGRPKLSQVPYTGAEAVKKIFEQFSQMSASLNRFSVQLESIQDSAKHISVEFHALAFQMRASRSLFSNDHHGGGQKSGLAGHFANRSGGGEKSDQEILASFAMRENAKILIRKQLATRNNVKDPTLNDDEVLADYKAMLIRKSDASTKFYNAEKAKREVVDSNNTTQDQRDHIEYLKKKMEWTRKFNENPTLVASKKTENKDRHVEYLKEKIKWTEAFNALPATVRDRLAKENARNAENLSKYKTFLETKSLLYEKFQKERRLQSEADKEKDDVKRKKDHPMPGDVGAYKRAQGVNTYKKEQTESAGALNNYVEYLVAKEIEYRAHQDRLAALRVSSKKDHKDPDEKPLEPFNKRTYVSTLDQPESLAEDINKFGEHYQKPLRSYVNYLTEKENVTAAHKKTMAVIKNADPTPEGQRRAAKKQKAEDDYQESIKGKTKEEIALIKPPEDMREDWYADKIAKLKAYYLEKLEITKWFHSAELAETAKGNDAKDDLFKTRAVRIANAKARRFNKPEEPSVPLQKETADRLNTGGYSTAADDALIASEHTLDVDGGPLPTTVNEDITRLVKTLKNVNVITADIETVTNATGDVNSAVHAHEAEIIQVSMIMRDDKGKDLLEPLNILINAVKPGMQLNQDKKFAALNASYLEADAKGTLLENDQAAKQMTAWIAAAKLIDPTATINRKGVYEDKFADAGNDNVKKSLQGLFGVAGKKRIDEGIDAASSNINSDNIIKQLIEIQKKAFKTSELQTKLTKAAADYHRRKGEHAEAQKIELLSETDEGKTQFKIEHQQEAFGLTDEGSTHDASTDTRIQDLILRELTKIALETKNNIEPPPPKPTVGDNLGNSIKGLLHSAGKNNDPVKASAAQALSAIMKQFYNPQEANIQALNEKEGDATLQIRKGTKNVTDVPYVEGVNNLLKSISSDMGIDIFKIFDKIKVFRGESVKGRAGEYQGRVGTSGEGENLKQSLSLAIPDAALFGEDAEARAKVIALIMEEAFVHGLSNKIPGLFGNATDVSQAQTELQGTFGAITKQTPEELAGAFDQGKYLSSFEELLSSVLKGIAGHNVSGLKDQNLPEGNFKYALNGISPILTAIKNALTGPILAALLVPMVIASTAGAGALEDERIAGFVNKKDGVEGSYIMDANAGRNFAQEDIIRRRTSTGPNAVEASIYGAREQKKIDDAKPSSAVQGIYQIRAEKEAEAARVAALKKKAEDAKAAQLAGPPPTEEETAALEETKEKEKADKDKKEQAWLAAGGVHGPGSTWPLTPPVEKPKTLDETIKNVVDAVVAIPAAIQNANINSPPLLRPKPVVNKPGSTPINTPFSSVIPTNNQAPQAPFHTTLPAPKPTPSFSLPGIPLTPKPLPTYEKPVSKKDQKYITTPLNIKDPLTSPHIKDADTYQTHQGPLRFITGDAPETGKPNVKGSELDQPGGKEAHEAARKFVAAAKKVEAKIAVDSTGKPKKDAYGRLLGDILLDGVSLIETLASEGHLHISEEAGNEKPLELMKEAARLKKGLWSKKNVKPDKWRKFTPAQKEAHIKDVKASGNIETPNNTVDEPTTPPPKPLAKPTPTPAPTPASSPNLEPTPSPSPTPTDIPTPEVDQVPEEKTSTTFAKLIALALGTAGLAGATLFRVLNKKKKEQEKPIAKPKSKPKPKPVTSLPKNKPTPEAAPEAAPKATPPAGTPKKNRFLDYRYSELKEQQEFREPRKGNNPDGSPNWHDFEIEDNANVDKEIERRDNFKPGIPGTLSKNKDNQEVYTGENGLQYLYQDGKIHTSFGVTGHADPNISITPKTPPTDLNPEPRPSIIKPAVAPKPAVVAPVAAPVKQPEEQSQEDKDFEALKDKRKVVATLAQKRVRPEDLTTGVLESVTTTKDGNDEKINAKDLDDSDLEKTLNYVERFIFKMIDRIIDDEKSTFEITKDDAGNITDATVNGSMQGDLNSLSTRLTDLHKLKREQRIRKEAENAPSAQPEPQAVAEPVVTPEPVTAAPKKPVVSERVAKAQKAYDDITPENDPKRIEAERIAHEIFHEGEKNPEVIKADAAVNAAMDIFNNNPKRLKAEKEYLSINNEHNQGGDWQERRDKASERYDEEEEKAYNDPKFKKAYKKAIAHYDKTLDENRGPNWEERYTEARSKSSDARNNSETYELRRRQRAAQKDLDDAIAAEATSTPASNPVGGTPLVTKPIEEEPEFSLPDDEPTPTREPARPSKNKAKNVPWKMGDGELYGSAASQIQVPMELMESPEVNAQMEKNHGVYAGTSTTQGMVNRHGGLNSHMMLAGLMGHSVTDQAFKDKTSNFDPATVAYLLQKEVDNFTGADRGVLDAEHKNFDPTYVKNMGEDQRGTLEQSQKKIEAYLKTAANPIFQKIARANLVIIQNQLNRLNDIKRSTAETTTEVKKDDDDEPLVLSEPSDVATEDAKDTKPEITKNPDVTKEEKQEEKKEEAATKINAEAKQAIPRWREEVPAGWAEVLAETLNRYNGEAYKDHDTIDINSIVNAVPITEETTETKETGETKDTSTKDPSAKKEYSYTATDPDKDNIYGGWEPTHYTYADNAEEAQQQAQKEFPGHKIDDIEDTADDKATTVLPQAETAIGVLGATFGAAVGLSFGTAAVGPIGGIIGSLIGGFIGKLGGNLLVGDFNNKRAERFEEREADKKIRQKEKKQKEDEATNTPEIARAKNLIETKEKERSNLQNLQSPKDLEAKLQKQKMNGADISDADIDVAVQKQTEAVEASADAIEKLKQELQALEEILADLNKNKPDSEPSTRSRSVDPGVEHKVLGGYIGGKAFPGEAEGVDRRPIWAQDGEYVTPKKDVPNMIRALGAYKRRNVPHMAGGGVVGGGSASGGGSGQTRPSSGSYSSGDVLGPFKDKLNDFIKNTKFGAFVSNLTEASAKIQGLSQSMSGMVANASPDTFATFTNSIKLLSGAVGIALIPIFMKASQVIQTWAQQIMNGTGTIGKLFTMFSSIVNTVLDGQLLSIGVGIAIMGAAMLPVIAFFGAMVTGISALIQGFVFLRGAVLASALMMRRTAALPAAAPLAAGAVPLAAGAAPLAAGAVPLATAAVPVASRGAQALAAGKAALGGVGASTGILSGIIGGVTEGIENSDIKSMGAGENATRIGAQAVGGGGGALGGAMGGAALGTLILPGIGTAIGGLIGGVLGGMAGSKVASVGSDAAFGDKRRNEGKKDKDGNTLPEETKKDKAKKDLAMSYQSSKSQSSYSSVEEAYKKIQVSALGDDPMTAELKKMNEVGLLNMLKELEKINEGVRGKEAPLGLET